MAKQKPDGISWADFTFSLWHGCTRIHGSPACEDAADPSRITCYAEAISERFGYSAKPGAAYFPIWGADTQRRFLPKVFERIAQANKEWAGRERRCRAFVMSMGDWAEGRPDQADVLAKLWPAIAAAQNVDFLMLTKRPQLIRTLCPFSTGASDLTRSASGYCHSIWRTWQGTTTENQHWLDIRWPHLRDATFSDQITWLSIEPQVGPIKLPQDFLDRGKRAWVVVGGQSGRKVVKFDPDWARRLRDQCREAGVPYHFKQMSGFTKAELKAIPEDLQIHEYPTP